MTLLPTVVLSYWCGWPVLTVDILIGRLTAITSRAAPFANILPHRR
jgi:hypothetical protein